MTPLERRDLRTARKLARMYLEPEDLATFIAEALKKEREEAHAKAADLLLNGKLLSVTQPVAKSRPAGAEGKKA